MIGGAQVYEDALSRADVLALTELELAVGGDTFFPLFDRKVFIETTREPHVSAEGVPFAFVTYERT